MYRRPKFLEVLLDIRREMASEADHDVDLFAELVRSGERVSPAETVNAASEGAIDIPDVSTIELDVIAPM